MWSGFFHHDDPDNGTRGRRFIVVYGQGQARGNGGFYPVRAAKPAVGGLDIDLHLLADRYFISIDCSKPVIIKQEKRCLLYCLLQEQEVWIETATQ